MAITLRGSKSAGQAALRRRTFGSLGRFQGCLAGGPLLPRTTLSLRNKAAQLKSQISRSPGAFCAGFFISVGTDTPPSRPSGQRALPAVPEPGAAYPHHTYEATVPSSRQTRTACSSTCCENLSPPCADSIVSVSITTLLAMSAGA